MALSGRVAPREPGAAYPLVGPIGRAASVFKPSEYDPIADVVDDEFPFVLTTGRRLEFFNTGVQTRAYPSARRQEELLWIHPDDAATYGIERGERFGFVPGAAN